MESEKYKIYLPEAVKSRLVHDATLFEITKKNGDTNLNLFLKAVLLNYYEKYSQWRTDIFLDIVTELRNNVSIDQQHAEAIAAHFLELVDRDSLKQENDCPITLTVSGRTYEILENAKQQLFGTQSLSQFVRDLFTSYLSVPRNEREAIVFSESYNMIASAINDNRTITCSASTSPDITYHICPYSITSSKEEQFNYLLCYDIDRDIVRSFRLCRLRRIFVQQEPYHMEDSIIQKLERARLEGPQFAFQTTTNVCVRFSKEGQRLFKLIVANRPVVKKAVGDMVYFEWPENQLMEYLKRFGKDAEVIEPKALRDQMRQYYMSAAQQYS